MRIINHNQLTPVFFEYQELPQTQGVSEILASVKAKGDQALIDFTQQFDGVAIQDLKVESATIKKALQATPQSLRQAIQSSIDNLIIFAQAQKKQFQDFNIEVQKGVTASQKIQPLEKVGVYVPGGSFPLISSVLMGVVPAQVAGVKKITICSPPTYQGDIHPFILAAANILGIENIYRVGGAHSIAAMAYGTSTIEKVDKIVGPGNAYVTQAKKEVFGIVGIDLIAGPSEILIIADEKANPALIAADLLAQAEHDINALSLLFTNSESLALQVQKEIDEQLATLPTKQIAEQSLKNAGLIVLFPTLEQAVASANLKAPEHLELQVENPELLVPQLTNYGSLFIGEESCEVLGDYASGLNHTLPTNTTARYSAGLSVRDFLKLQTQLTVNKEGLKEIGPSACELAKAEGLWAHQLAVAIRLAKNDT